MSGYDPLDYDNLARSIVNALLDTSLLSLPPEHFEGSGVYAIYYTEPLEYRADALARGTPIYVGKAVPTGGRKGVVPGGVDRALYRRLRDHAKSITHANNLSLDHAKCRYLALVPVWTTLAERFLLTHFRPLWNTVLDGFGNHDPGHGRRNSACPRWDILHPGRPWAAELRLSETKEDILADIQDR